MIWGDILLVLLGAVIALGAVFCGHSITLNALKPRPDKVDKTEAALSVNRYSISNREVEQPYASVPRSVATPTEVSEVFKAPAHSTAAATPAATPTTAATTRPTTRPAAVPVQVTQTGSPIDRRGR